MEVRNFLREIQRAQIGDDQAADVAPALSANEEWAKEFARERADSSLEQLRAYTPERPELSIMEKEKARRKEKDAIIARFNDKAAAMQAELESAAPFKTSPGTGVIEVDQAADAAPALSANEEWAKEFARERADSSLEQLRAYTPERPELSIMEKEKARRKEKDAIIARFNDKAAAMQAELESAAPFKTSPGPTTRTRTPSFDRSVSSSTSAGGGGTREDGAHRESAGAVPQV